MDQIKELDNVLVQADDEIKDVNDLNALQQKKANFLGKKGPIAAVMATMRDLSIEAKKELGQKSNVNVETPKIVEKPQPLKVDTPKVEEKPVETPKVIDTPKVVETPQEEPSELEKLAGANIPTTEEDKPVKAIEPTPVQEPKVEEQPKPQTAAERLAALKARMKANQGK